MGLDAQNGMAVLAHQQFSSSGRNAFAPDVPAKASGQNATRIRKNDKTSVMDGRETAAGFDLVVALALQLHQRLAKRVG